MDRVPEAAPRAPGHSARGLVWLRRMARASGYGHDLGKANAWFLGKLAKPGRIADPVRHEVLSVLLRRALPQAGTMARAFREAVRALARWEDGSGGARFLGRPVDASDVVDWVIATHHRLPAAEFRRPHLEYHRHHPTPGEEAQARRARKRMERLAGDPLAHEGLAQAYAKSWARLAKAGGRPDENWVSGMFLLGRLAMIVGDQYTSGLDLGPAAGPLRANSDSAQRPAQGLSEHLLEAGTQCARAVDVLWGLECHLPALAAPERERLEAQAPARFGWQNEAAAAAEAFARTPGAAQYGQFVVLCASTGSGKTWAGARIASALAGPRMRLTTLLGLRTLTLQTGDAYARQLGIPREKLSVVIGSREVRRLHESLQADEADEEALRPQVHGGPDAGALPDLIEAQLRDEGSRRMLATPALVSTVDYLVQAADWRRTRHVAPQLRLLSSDVLLDEVDGYDLSDYPALGRLCYLVGLFGRRLILSSATAMPEIVAPLFAAYQAGRRALAAVSGLPGETYTLFAADTAAPQGQMCSSAEALERHYQSFTARVAAGAARRPVERRGRWARIRTVSGILRACRGLHRGNAVEAEGGVRASAGLVRFARVRDAAQVARALAARAKRLEGKGVYLRVISYHSNLPLAVRAHIEHTLDGWLQRGGPPEADPFLIGELVAEARRAGCREAMLIVVATPVEEVGRDHDFDYAVIEPSSDRSVTQCAGRVNRHRRRVLDPGEYNVIVLTHNARAIEAPGKACFLRPGFETDEAPFRLAGADAHDLSVIAPGLCTNLSAESCLVETPEDLLPQWERARIKQALHETLTEPFTDSLMGKLTAEHFDRYAFREGEESIGIYYALVGQCWLRLSPEGEGVASPCLPREAQPPGPGFWFSGPGRLEAMASDVAARVGMDPHDEAFSRDYLCVSLPARVYKSRCVADPLLGVWQTRESVFLANERGVRRQGGLGSTEAA